MQRPPTERDGPVISNCRAAAERYVHVIDTATDDPDPYTFFARAGPSLADLCVAALALPDLWDDGWTFRGERSVSAKVKVDLAIERRLRDLLDELNYYESVAPFDTPRKEGRRGSQGIPERRSQFGLR